MTATYTCAACGETYEFDETWRDDDARAEFADLYPGHDVDTAGIICDDCHKKLTAGAAHQEDQTCPKA